MSVTVRVPAKVNVQLAVGAARPDGFHDLANVFLAVGLYDEVTVTPPTDSASPARARTRPKSPGRHELGGTGGRSTRRAVRTRPRRAHPHRQGHPRRRGHGGRQRGRGGRAGGVRRAVGHRCLPGRTARHLRGVGQRCAVQSGGRGGARRRARREADRPGDRRHLPLGVRDGRAGAVDPGGVPGVRPAGEGTDIPEPVASQPLLDALAKGDPDALAAAVSNDLQPAALSLFPELADTLAAGRSAGALAALVSGSGPTTAFLVRDPGSATKVAEALTASGTCRTVRTATAPAAGATVLDRPSA